VFLSNPISRVFSDILSDKRNLALHELDQVQTVNVHVAGLTIQDPPVFQYTSVTTTEALELA